MASTKETPTKAEVVVSSQADPDVRNAFGIDDAAAAIGIASTAAKAGKKAYEILKPDVPITVTIVNSNSLSNQRTIGFEVKNISRHTVYIEEIGISGIEQIELSRYSPGQIGHFGDSGWLDLELPHPLRYNDEAKLQITFNLARSAELRKDSTRKLKIGYCWISDAKPNRVLKVDFAIRWPGSFVME